MKLIKVSLMFVIIIILYSCSNNESITNPNISNNSDTNSLKKEFLNHCLKVDFLEILYNRLQ